MSSCSCRDEGRWTSLLCDLLLLSSLLCLFFVCSCCINLHNFCSAIYWVLGPTLGVPFFFSGCLGPIFLLQPLLGDSGILLAAARGPGGTLLGTLESSFCVFRGHFLVRWPVCLHCQHSGCLPSTITSNCQSPNLIMWGYCRETLPLKTDEEGIISANGPRK